MYKQPSTPNTNNASAPITIIILLTLWVTHGMYHLLKQVLTHSFLWPITRSRWKQGQISNRFYLTLLPSRVKTAIKAHNRLTTKSKKLTKCCYENWWPNAPHSISYAVLNSNNLFRCLSLSTRYYEHIIYPNCKNQKWNDLCRDKRERVSCIQ